MVNNQDVHRRYMRRALKLAAKGAGLTSPNPMVGSVIVRRNRIVGEGFHLFAKKDHAEIIALREAGERAKGADLYVSLEPCCHQGRTPPCVDEIIARGIRRVFVAVEDSNPDVQGKGIDHLRKAGIEVHVGYSHEEARRQNEVFFHYITTGLPFVTLKLAMTLDGKIATASGDSRWITSSASRMLVHQLRFESDVVMVGSGTVLQDDPTLNVRSEAKNSITRVLLDSRLRTVPRARLFEAKDPVLIYHHLPASQEALEGLSTRAELIRVSSIRQELDLTEVLSDLATRNLTSVLVEGGARVATSLIKESLANKLLLFYAPKLVGSDGISAFSLLGVERISKAPEFKVTSQRAIDGDILVELVPR